MKNIAIFGCLAAILAIAGCQTAQQEMEKSGGVKLQKSEVLERIAGYTIPWISAQGAGFYAADGQYYYKDGEGNTGRGIWYVNEKGTLCLKVEGWWDNQTRCNWDTYLHDGVQFSYDIEKADMRKSKIDQKIKGNAL